MLTHEVLKLAVGDSAKGLREALRALGKCVSLRWVYYLTEPPADVRRPNPYGSFLLLFEALWRAHRKGAEFLFEDFCARVTTLREPATPQHDTPDWYEQLAICAREQSEALQAAIRRHDDAAIRRELSESIAAERTLLALLDRHEPRAAQKAA